jgi:predicted outer membrane repeat protein
MVFSSNTVDAYVYGGAMYFGQSWAFFPAGSNKQSISFLYNTAGAGGAMYFSNMLTTVTFSPATMTFAGNTALTSNGGAMNFYNTILLIETTSIEFRNNVSLIGSGGAMAFRAGSSVTFAGQYMRFKYNIAQTSGGAMYFNASNAAYFKDIKVLEFIGNTAKDWIGGGMAFIDMKPIITFIPSSMTFSSNTAYSDGGGMNFTKTTVSFASIGSEPSSMSFLYNRSMTGSGGAMYFDSSSATFAMNREMIFRFNIASISGGAMYFQNSSAAYFRATQRLDFTSNTAVNGSGGAMYFMVTPNVSFAPSSMTFAYNTAKSSGGGMYFSGTSVTFAAAAGVNSSMSFIRNTALTGSGGAMYFDGSSATFAMNREMIFRQNISSINGGAMYFQNSSAAYFRATQRLDFTSNTAVNGSGGAMYFMGVPRADFAPVSMTFMYNTAKSSGGGMYFSGTSVTFAASAGVNSSMSFIRNTAVTGSGGGMYFDNSSATFAMNREMIFRQNISSINGGAMYFQNSSAAYFKPTDRLEFTSNTAFYGRGGAMYFTKTSTVIFEPSVLSFSSNASGISGGAMYFDGSRIEFRAQSAMIFRSNISSMSGGALYLLGSTASFTGNGDLEMDGNRLLAVGKSSGGGAYLDRSTMIFQVNGQMKFTNHTGAYGAVLYGTNNSYIKFADSGVLFSSNTSQKGNGIISWDNGTRADFINLKTVEVIGNEAVEGGFLYIKQAGFSISALDFRARGNNAASGNGGVYYFESSTFIFSATYSTFTANTANKSGGAIYLAGKSSAEFRAGGADFISNSALSGSGAAVYAAGGSYILFNSTVAFNSNSAAYAGGGIFLDFSFLQVKGNLGLYSNRASSGAGIYVMGSTFTSSGTVRMEGNIASQSGGGIYMASGSSAVFITTGVFISNSARYGGGLYLDKSNLQGNLEFTKNSGVYGGGAYVSITSLGMVRTDIRFSGNTAAVVSANGLTVGRGGALYMIGSTLSFVGSTISFIGNRLNNGTSKGMGAGMGAYLREGSLLNLNGGFLRVIEQGRLIFREDGRFERKNEDGVFYLEDDKSDIILTGANIEAISNGYFNDERFYGSGGFFEFNGDGGALSSLTFTGGYFNLVSNEGKRGGAIYAEEYNLTFDNRGYGGLSSMNFTNNSAIYGGGAIYLRDAVLSFNNQKYIRMIGNIFDGREAEWKLGRSHGANTANDIYLEGGSVLTFNTIKAGTATISGGIYASGDGFINKNGEGTLYLSGVNYFDNISSFGVIGHGAVSARGGEWSYIYNRQGIYVGSSVFRAEDADVLFQYNVSEFGGGGLDLRDRSKGVISSSNGIAMIFLSNTSQKISNSGGTDGGGSINIKEKSVMSIAGGNIVFRSNEAARRAGYRVPRAIEDRGSVSNIAVGNYYFLPFSEGEARVRGGAIYIEDAYLEISARRGSGSGQLLFIGNTDETGANDIYMRNGTIDIKNGDGRSELYGGIYAEARSTINVLKDGLLDNGLLYLSGYNYFVDITSFGIEANTLVALATFTYINNDKPLFIKASTAVFEHSKVDFVGNRTSELGGALRAKDGSYVEFTRQSYVNFIANTAYSGGAIYAYNGSTVLFTAQSRVRFDGNNAVSSGGVIYADFNSYIGAFLYTDLCEFTGSAVRDAGGAIYVYDGSTLILSEINTLRASDNAASSGGFIYVGQRSKAIFDATDLIVFERNTALESGGVLYVTDNSTISFSNIKHLDVLNNKSLDGDGVFYSGNNSKIVFDNVYNIRAEGNRANNGGFMSISDNNDINSYGFSIQANNNTAAAGNGGAFSIVKVSVDFDTLAAILDSEFNNNMASGLGGAIYIEDAAVTIKALAYNTYFGLGGLNRELGGAQNDINIVGDSVLNLVTSRDKVIEFASGIKTEGGVVIDKTGYGEAIMGGVLQIKGRVSVEDGYLTMKTPSRMNPPDIPATPYIQEVEISKYGEIRTPDDNGQYGVYISSLTLYGTMGIGIDSRGGAVYNDLMVFDELTIGPEGLLRIFWSEFEPIEKGGIRIIEAGRINGDYFANYPGNGYEVFSEDGPFSGRYRLNYGRDSERGLYYVSLDILFKYDYSGIGKQTDLSPNESEAARQIDKAQNGAGIMSSLFDQMTKISKEDRALGDVNYTRTKAALNQIAGSFLPNVIAANALGNTGRLYSKIAYEEGLPNEDSGILQMIWVEGDYGGGYYHGQNGRDGAETFRNDYYGVTAGFPLWRGKNDLGIYGSFSDKRVRQGINEGRIEDIEGGIYMGHYGGGINVKGHIGISRASNETMRRVAFGEYDETARGFFDLTNIRFGAELEREIKLDEEAKAKPFVGVNGGFVINGEIGEEYGNALNLTVAGGEYIRLDFLAGLKIEDTFGLYRWNIKGYGGYIAEGEEPRYKISFSNMESSQMDIVGIELSRLYGGLSAWIEYAVTEDISLFGNADFNYGKDNINYYGNIGLKYRIGGSRAALVEVKEVKEIKEKKQEQGGVAVAEAGAEAAVAAKESVIRIAACEFNLGSYEIGQLGKERIKQIAGEIKKLKWTKVTAAARLNIGEGSYSDSRYYLAIERAKAVYEEMYKNGIEIEGLDYTVKEYLPQTERQERQEQTGIQGQNDEYGLESSVYMPKENIVFIEIEYIR